MNLYYLRNKVLDTIVEWLAIPVEVGLEKVSCDLKILQDFEDGSL